MAARGGGGGGGGGGKGDVYDSSDPAYSVPGPDVCLGGVLKQGLLTKQVSVCVVVAAVNPSERSFSLRAMSLCHTGLHPAMVAHLRAAAVFPRRLINIFATAVHSPVSDCPVDSKFRSGVAVPLLVICRRRMHLPDSHLSLGALSPCRCC